MISLGNARRGPALCVVLVLASLSKVKAFSLKGYKPGCFFPHTRQQESVGAILPCGNDFSGFQTYMGDWCECRENHEWAKVVGTDPLHSNHVVPQESSYLASCFRKSSLDFVPSGSLVSCRVTGTTMCTCDNTKLLDIAMLQVIPAPSIDPDASFRELDTNRDDKHCQDEIEASMMLDLGWVKHAKLGIYVDSVVLEGFEHADLDRDGVVTLREFLDAMPGKTREDFDAADVDHDGKHTLQEQISQEATAKIAKDIFTSSKQAKEHIAKADTDGDKCVSRQEYLRLL